MQIPSSPFLPNEREKAVRGAALVMEISFSLQAIDKHHNGNRTS